MLLTTGLFSVCGIAIASVSSPSSLLFLFSSSILCVRFHSSRYATISLSRDIQRLLLALRVPRDLVARVLLRHVEPALVEVHVLPCEAEHLSAPHARVQGEQHRAVRGARREPEDDGVEPLRFVDREAVPLLGLRPGYGYVGAGVLGDEPVVDRLVHDLGELLVDAV